MIPRKIQSICNFSHSESPSRMLGYLWRLYANFLPIWVLFETAISRTIADITLIRQTWSSVTGRTPAECGPPPGARAWSCHNHSLLVKRAKYVYRDENLNRADAHKEGTFHSFQRKWPTDRLALWSFYKLWLALAGCDAQFWLKCQYTLITAYIMT